MDRQPPPGRVTGRPPAEPHWLNFDGDARTACGLLPHEYERSTSILADVECPSCQIEARTLAADIPRRMGWD